MTYNFNYTRNPHTITVRLPKRFYDDHVARDLPAGDVFKETSKHFVVALTVADYDEVLDDARHYVWLGTTGDLDPEYSGLVASARATVKILEGIAKWRTDDRIGVHRPGMPTLGPDATVFCLDCSKVLSTVEHSTWGGIRVEDRVTFADTFVGDTAGRFA